MTRGAAGKILFAACFALIVTGLDVFVHWEAAALSHFAVFLYTLGIGLVFFLRPLSRYAENKDKKILRDLFIEHEWNQKDTLFFGVIFTAFVLLYLPSYLALFPGTLGYDTPIQLAMFYGDKPMTAGNPIAHTLLLGSLTKAGELIWGQAQSGFALYILLQFLTVAFALSYAFLFLRSRRLPVFPMAAGFLWIALSSEMRALSFNATKDILFGALLLIFMIRFAGELTKEREGERKGGWISLFFSAFLVCLFRNPCIIIMICLCICCFLFKIRNRRIYLAFLPAILCTLLFNGLSSAVFDIRPGDRTVAAFVPAQQLGLTASYAADPDTQASVRLTEDEAAGIRELIPERVILDERHEFSADSYFAAFDEARYKTDRSRYIRLWFEIGRKNKGIYLHAFRNLVKPYFDAAYNPYRQLVFEESFPELDHHGIGRRSFLPEYYERLYDEVVEKSRYFPLLQPGIGIFLGILLLLDAVYRKRWKQLLIVFPLAVYFAGWLIGPVALLRYLYPLMISVPLLWGLLFLPEEAPCKDLN